MTRATKIVATLGPASSDPVVLEALLRAGVDVVRLNFSHGTAQDHLDRAALVRSVAEKVGKPVALMADLQGPKIRVGKFAEGKVLLLAGAAFVLDAQRSEPGDLGGVGLDYKELPRDLRPGDILLLNDGLIKISVEAVRGEQVHTRVILCLLVRRPTRTGRFAGLVSIPAFLFRGRRSSSVRSSRIWEMG